MKEKEAIQPILEENLRRRRAMEPPAASKPRRTADPDRDFEQWAARRVKIKPKGGGPDVPFLLNNPQRRLVAELESMRQAGKPIRLVLLKARQWGGSTCIQLYMAWLQIVHSEGLNSLIISHQINSSEVIKDMFDRMASHYGDPGDPGADRKKASGLTLKRVGRGGSTFRLVERDCKITVGSAERPDSSRGGDYNLVHLSEVGLWKRTAGKKPEDIVRSATSGVLLRPMTMIVLESTANGAGTYFHREYLAAKEGESQFRALFVPWYEIKDYQLEFADDEERESFAEELYERREDETATGRSESGSYHWSLWERGATLEAINWYVSERRKYADHGSMASEYPSDDIEAFVHSGQRVFAPDAIDRLRHGVEPPAATGDIEPVDLLQSRRLAVSREVEPFYREKDGPMEVWRFPETEKRIKGRYMVVVDIGGRSDASDWSVITVIDRQGVPSVVAQWRGHIDHDLLAGKAAAIGRWYGGATLVVESNTLETSDAERDVDGQQAPFILRQLQDRYPNLYMRRGAGGSVRPGFHTNVGTKPMVIGTLVKLVREGGYVERDHKAIEELIQYERKPNGSFGAYSGCHDDILMTRAIGLHLHLYELPPPREVAAPGPAPSGYGGRRRGPQDAFGVF